MAQKKPLGGQLDIQDVAAEIANNATAIGSIATGVTTDSGAKATMDADYLRRDGGAGSPPGMLAALDMGTFAITNVGNVDGRDVSADGTAQDSHIANVNLHFTEASIDHDNILHGTGTYSHTEIDTHIDTAAQHRLINDAGTTATDLFSASKIIASLALKSDTTHSHLFNALTDVLVGSPVTNQGLTYNGTNWVNSDVILTGSGVSVGGIDVFYATNGNDLEFKGIAALPAGTGGIVVANDASNKNVTIDIVPSAIAASLTVGDISDVTLTGSPAPALDDILRFNGTDWTNVKFATQVTSELGNNSINALSDVAITGSPLTVADVLAWNGSNWAPTTNPAGVTTFPGLSDVPAYAGNGDRFVMINTAANAVEFNQAMLGNLFDVDTTTTPPAEAYVLSYDGANWVPTNGATRSYYLAKKATAGTLAVGTPVYLVGFDGTYATVEAADAAIPAKMPAVGVVGTTVTDTTHGEVVVCGPVFGFDTSAWTAGDELFVAAGGGLSTEPAGEANQIQKMSDVLLAVAGSPLGGLVNMGSYHRANSTPNLDSGDFFLGNVSNKAVAAVFATEVTSQLGSNNLDSLADVTLTAGSPDVAGEALVYTGSVWQNTAIVNSFEGRTGAVVATAGDYLASEITYVPSGSPEGISAVTVQAALDELDSEKAPVASPVFTGVPVLPTYTVGTLPTVVDGGMIYVSDATSGSTGSPVSSVTGVMCFGNVQGSPEVWIDVLTGQPVA
jgi:hypothetical protein